MLLPRYPVYIPSKGRAASSFTARTLQADKVPFALVVEPAEVEQYRAVAGRNELLTLPINNGGLIYARNWIKAHATATGAERHWQLDDNMTGFLTIQHGRRLYCSAGAALRITEDFVDRFDNVAIAGLNYDFFAIPNAQALPPFRRNVHVYSCSLILNSLPYQWRSRYNDDTDMCLQVLAGGWCTILMNAFLVHKLQTMKVNGGNTADLYQGDGRLKMARALERLWPGVVKTVRRFDRPQHFITDQWSKFDTPLQLKAGLKLEDLPTINDYDLQLRQVGPVKAPALRALLAEREGQQS